MYVRVRERTENAKEQIVQAEMVAVIEDPKTIIRVIYNGLSAHDLDPDEWDVAAADTKQSLGVNQSMADRYLEEAGGNRLAAATYLALDLMRGEAIVHKAGYSMVNAATAAVDLINTNGDVAPEEPGVIAQQDVLNRLVTGG